MGDHSVWFEIQWGEDWWLRLKSPLIVLEFWVVVKKILKVNPQLDGSNQSTAVT